MQVILFEEAIVKGGSLIGSLLVEHREKIEAAYLNANGEGEGSEKCKVSMSVIFEYTNKGIEVQADLSFIESKIKGSAKCVISSQEVFPGMDT